MFLKYCRLSFFIALLISAPIFAQDADIDSDKQREQYEKKMKAQLDKEINDFITTLDADDFQKEIIKQKMHSYYEKRKSIYMDTSIKPFERDEQLSILPEQHFTEIKSMMTEETLEKVKSFLKDGGTGLKKQHKKDKKKDKKKKEQSQ